MSENPVNEEKRCLKEKRICFGCLHYSDVSRRCRDWKVCETCSMPHPTILHDESKTSPKQSSEDQAEVVQSAEATSSSGFLLEAGSRVPAPVYFEQSTRLLEV